MKTLMNALMSDPQMRLHAKEIPKFAQKIITDVQGMENELMISLTETDFDETTALKESLDFLQRVVECDVEIFNADDAGYDPQGKSRMAVPMRPAIYIE
jgi:leucyl-tRNA synthetase